MVTITYERNTYPTDIPVIEQLDIAEAEVVESDDEPSLYQTLSTDLHTLAEQARHAKSYELSAVLNSLSSVSDVETALAALASRDAWCGVARSHEQYGSDGGPALAEKILQSDPIQRGVIIREILDTPRPEPAKIGEQVMRHIPNHEIIARSEQSPSAGRRNPSRLSRYILGSIY